MQNTISFNTRFGWITATEYKNTITEVRFKKGKNIGKKSKHLVVFKKNIYNYFNSKINKIKSPIKIIGNNSQKKIWKNILKIKKGETKSYGYLARKLSFSPRYIGKVCAENKLLLIIPCHRVIKSNGDLGGYSASGGLKLKKKLLNFEKEK